MALQVVRLMREAHHEDIQDDMGHLLDQIVLGEREEKKRNGGNIISYFEFQLRLLLFWFVDLA